MTQHTYVDPSRLFVVKLPQGFKRDEETDTLIFDHPEIDGRVNIACFRHAGDDPAVKLFDSLPSRDSMQNIRHSDKDDTSIHYGDYLGEFQNESIRWRWWTMQRGEIALVVSYNGNPSADAVARAPVDALVAGIKLCPSPPMRIEDFTAIAAKIYAEVLETPEPEILKPLELSTQPPGTKAGKKEDKSVLRLENAYVTYLDIWDNDPDCQPAEQLRHWFERLWGEDHGPLGPFQEVRGLIYPVLKPAGFAEDAGVDVLRREVLEDELELLAAFDTGRTLRFLGKEDLRHWHGTDEEDVFFYARENLAALSKDMQMQALADQDGKPRAVIIATGDSFDASKLILPELYGKLSEIIGPNLLVGVPNRDFMIVLNADDEELVRNVATQVQQDARTRAYAISGKLYRLTAEGVQARS